MTQNTEVRNNIVFRLDYIDYDPISQHDLRHYIISGLCSFPGVSHILSQRKLIRSTRCLPSERILCKQIYKVSRLTHGAFILLHTQILTPLIHRLIPSSPGIIVDGRQMHHQQTCVLFTHYLKYFGTLLYSCQYVPANLIPTSRI